MADEETNPEPQPSAPRREKQPAAPPVASNEPTITYRERGGFHYPIASRFTGLVQFRYDSGAECDAPPSGKWLRGEVKRIGSQSFADRLVEGGLHSHVDPNTPLGQPEKFKPAAPETKE